MRGLIGGMHIAKNSPSCDNQIIILTSTFGYENNGKSAIVFRFAKDALVLPETLELVGMLRLTPGKTLYPAPNHIYHL